MALGTFDQLNASTNTFSEWLVKTNEMIVLFRDDVVTANSDGATTTGNTILVGDFVANTLVAADELRGGDLSTSGALTISTNATCSANLTVSGTLSIGSGNLSYTIDSSNYTDLIPSANGDLLGNTEKRWEASFTEVDVSGNVDVTDTLTVDSLVVSNTATLPELSFSGETTFENITVSGNADISSLVVTNLTTNKAGIIGVNSDVSSNADTVIDSFEASQSKGFKYIIHGEANSDPTSAYGIEINCSHNDTSVFYTRYGEVSNNFDAVLTPRIVSGNVELVASCSSAEASNVHSFNIVRIETRNG